MATYFTDFSEYASDAQPSDWTARWHGGSWIVRTDAGATGGKILEIRNGVGDYAITWDELDADANRADIEIVYRFRSKELDGDPSLYAIARADGTGANEAGYMLGTASDSLAEINTMSAGSTPALTSTTISDLVQDQWYWIRARVNGTSLKLRLWTDGNTEPSTWLLETTDSTYSAGDFAGLATEDGDAVDVDVFGVGTNGDTAPTSASSGTTVTTGQATETDTANAVGRKRTLTTGQATETDTATALVISQIVVTGLASETDTASTVGHTRALTTGQATETDTAVAVGGAKVATTGQATETSTAATVAAGKVELALQALEDSLARAVTPRRTRTVALATEADTASAIAVTGAYQVGLAVETDAATAVGRQRAAAVGLATAADTAQPTSHAKALVVGLSGDTSSSFGVVLSRQAVVGLANEGDTATGVEAVGGAQPEPGEGDFWIIKRRRRWV